MGINYDKYLMSTGTHYISNSGSDEKGNIKGGAAGDQTGKEWQLKAWYKRPWTVVLRYPDQSVSLTIAKLGIAAALNNKIGYDQGQRTTYWTQLKKVGYDPSKIITACEEDCTAGVTANVKAAGYIHGIVALEKISTSTNSRNMRMRFQAAGFKALTDSKYLTSGKYLYPGDILLYENHHAATNITCGTAVRGSWSGSTPSPTRYALGDRTLKNGMSGDDVKELQSALIKLGFNCGRWGADGDFVDATQMAVQDFQKSYGLKPNGIFDRESYEMLMKADDSIDLLPVDPIYVEIVGGNCYIRTGPFKECSAIKVAYDGQRLPFAGLINEENGWLEVEYEPDKFGWVSPKYGRITG